MSWSVQEWKKEAADRLIQIGFWLERKTPFAVYSALCGLSLWPLVEAAQHEGLLPAMRALGSVAGGVGGNLIAEQIQRWRDAQQEGNAPERHAAVEWVAERAPRDAELRQALDEILEALGSLAAARSALDESEQAAFDAALRREMAQLGNLGRFAADLDGAGAIAQGAGARAVGQGGALVEGDVAGDVVTGSKHTDMDLRGQTVGSQIIVEGDVMLAPLPERERARSREPAAREPSSADAGTRPAGWDRERLRDLLTAALSDHDLEVLCYDHFPAAYPEFSEGMTKAQKIQRLLAYCVRTLQTDRLLGLVRERNRAQYERFRPA